MRCACIPVTDDPHARPRVRVAVSSATSRSMAEDIFNAVMAMKQAVSVAIEHGDIRADAVRTQCKASLLMRPRLLTVSLNCVACVLCCFCRCAKAWACRPRS